MGCPNERVTTDPAPSYWTIVLYVEGLALARFGRRIFTQPPPDVGRGLDEEKMLQLRQTFRPVPLQTWRPRLRRPGECFHQRRRFEADRMHERQQKLEAELAALKSS